MGNGFSCSTQNKCAAQQIVAADSCRGCAASSAAELNTLYLKTIAPLLKKQGLPQHRAPPPFAVVSA